MASKVVREKRAEAERLRRAAEIFKREVAAVAEGKLAACVSEGEDPPNLALMADLSVCAVEQRLKRLIAADEALERARAALPEARCERDLARAALARELGGLKKLCRGLYGQSAGNLLVQEIPQPPLALARTGKAVVRRVRSPKLRLPPVAMPGVEIDLQVLATELEPRVDALQRALLAVEEGTVAVTCKQEAKRVAVKRFDAECVAGLRLLVDLAVLVGRRDLAGRMRSWGRG